MKAIFSLSLIIVMTVATSAQEVGSWWMYFGNIRMNERFSVWTETQYRSHDHGENIEQLMLRIAINYHLTEKSMFSFGYGYVGNFQPESDIYSPDEEEGRVYEQYILKHKIPSLLFEHRFRVEQRWVQNIYKNRFRYRLFLTIPLNNNQIEKNTLFLGIYDEIFLNTVEEYFDRNRFYIAMGYQINQHTNVQSGMLNQSVKNFDKWYFQLALTWMPDLRK